MKNLNIQEKLFSKSEKSKLYDPIGSKDTVELTISMLHKREKSKRSRSGEKAQRNLKPRSSNAHIRSTKIA